MDHVFVEIHNFYFHVKDFYFVCFLVIMYALRQLSRLYRHDGLPLSSHSKKKKKKKRGICIVYVSTEPFDQIEVYRAQVCVCTRVMFSFPILLYYYCIALLLIRLNKCPLKDFSSTIKLVYLLFTWNKTSASVLKSLFHSSRFTFRTCKERKVRGMLVSSFKGTGKFVYSRRKPSVQIMSRKLVRTHSLK